MKNIILIYPSFERGGVKLNFMSYLKVLKKTKLNIFILSDKKILKEVKIDKKIKWIPVDDIKISFFYKHFTSLISAYKIFKNRKLFLNKETRIISFQSSFFISIMSKLLRFKMIARVSEDPLEALNNSESYVYSYFVSLTKFITYNLSYKILVNSKKMKSSVGKFTIDKKKICLQYNMNLKSVNKFNLKRKKNIFLCIGRFCKQKNQSVILYAFKIFLSTNKNKDFLLYLCGDGPDKDKLKSICNQLELKNNVKFFKWQNNTDTLMKKVKYLILPSLYEGLPNVLIDAVNNDLLCLCTSVSGVKDICGENYVHIDDNYTDIFDKMNYSVNNYNFLIKKNFKYKKTLRKFLSNKLFYQLKRNIS